MISSGVLIAEGKPSAHRCLSIHSPQTRFLLDAEAKLEYWKNEPPLGVKMICMGREVLSYHFPNIIKMPPDFMY